MILRLLLVQAVLACSDVLKGVSSDEELLEMIKGWSEDKRNESANDLECLNQLVRHNYFESAKHLLNVRFGGKQE